MEAELSPVKVKMRIAQILPRFYSEFPLKGIRVIVDVDPSN
jgi:hypothetical protein